MRAVLGAAALLLVARTKVDVDLWGHVRFGGDILTSGITAIDPYSFTSDIPWVNHEWLAEVLFWLGWDWMGGGGLILIKLILVGLVLSLAWAVLRKYSLPSGAVEWLFVILVFGTWARTSVVRPQLFSLAIFAALLWVLQAVEDGRRWWIWAVPLIVVLWINLHGGWIVGFGTFGLYCALSLIDRSARLARPIILAVGALSVGSLLVNPYGWHMLGFIADTVGLSRSDIVDWQPLWRSGFLVILWLPAMVMMTIVLARHWRRVPGWQIAMTVALGLVSVRVSRLDAFFAIAVAMLMGPHLGELRAATERRRVHSAPLITAAATAIGIVVGSATQQPVTCIGLDVPWTPERQAGTFIAVNQLKGRLITWFDWGEYVIWHFGPALAVSVDGRRETVYSAAFLEAHDELYVNPDDNLAMLASMNADFAWLPVRMPLVGTLDRLGWVRIFDGPASVILSRRPGTFVTPQAPSGEACFPGP